MCIHVYIYVYMCVCDTDMYYMLYITKMEYVWLLCMMLITHIYIYIQWHCCIYIQYVHHTYMYGHSHEYVYRIFMNWIYIYIYIYYGLYYNKYIHIYICMYIPTTCRTLWKNILWKRNSPRFDENIFWLVKFDSSPSRHGKLDEETSVQKAVECQLAHYRSW